MDNSISILVSGGLIAAALFGGLMVDRYQVAGTFAVDGTPAVWRLNVRSGSVSLCLLNRHAENGGADWTNKFGVQCRN